MRHAAGAAHRIEAGGIGGERRLEDAAALAGRVGELQAGAAASSRPRSPPIPPASIHSAADRKSVV